MMGPRSDTADSRDYSGHLLDRPSLTELLEAAKLGYLEIGILDIALAIEEDLYLAVSF